MIEETLWHGKKRYRDKSVKKRESPPLPTFTERKAGDDPVQDIIDAADIIRHAHPSFRKAPPLAMEEGGVRIFWALTLEAARVAAGMSLDDFIERIRTEARP